MTLCDLSFLPFRECSWCLWLTMSIICVAGTVFTVPPFLHVNRAWLLTVVHYWQSLIYYVGHALPTHYLVYIDHFTSNELFTVSQITSQVVYLTFMWTLGNRATSNLPYYYISMITISWMRSFFWTLFLGDVFNITFVNIQLLCDTFTCRDICTRFYHVSFCATGGNVLRIFKANQYFQNVLS